MTRADFSMSDHPPMLLAFMRVGSIAAFAIAPLAALTTMIFVGLDPGPLAHDFHYELYPEAEALLRGRNPFPDPTFDPLGQPNLIWPPVVAFVVAPLTLIPIATADIVMASLGLLCFAAALRLVGVRDWRVYGALMLWPQVIGEMRVSHLTPVLALLTALAWKYRHSESRAGLAVGATIALKIFTWPLAVWLVATHGRRSTALAVSAASASALLVLPFTGLENFVRALLTLGRAFDQDSYTLFGFLVQLGASDGAARAGTAIVGVLLLIATWRYRSFTVAIAAALTLSPIVWLDYFALLSVPLAVHRPRLSTAWLVPIATWGAAGSGIGIGDPLDIARVLGAFAIVTAVCIRSERADHEDETTEPERSSKCARAYTMREHRPT